MPGTLISKELANSDKDMPSFLAAQKQTRLFAFTLLSWRPGEKIS